VVPVFSKFDRKTLQFMAEAVRDGKLVIPISLKLPLSEAAEAQAVAEKVLTPHNLTLSRPVCVCDRAPHTPHAPKLPKRSRLPASCGCTSEV
jgi:hypothetical protein